jgi:hypothetical protein
MGFFAGLGNELRIFWLFTFIPSHLTANYSGTPQNRIGFIHGVAARMNTVKKNALAV